MSPGATPLWSVFLPFAAGYFLSYLFRTVNAVISGEITAALGIEAADLGLLTSAYFLSFALFQLPLGLLLDRYGPRRVEAVLLLFAAAGALVFAASSQLAGLVAGRALIGLGVSACLMASFKAFVLWFPPQRLPALNGWVMAAGGLGAIAATAPVEAALAVSGWRGLFVVLALVTAAVAGAIYWLVPERDPPAPAAPGLRAQLRGTGQVFGSRAFRVVVPLTVLSQAGFLAVQGLWLGPWLRDVAGLPREEVAGALFATACGMVAGYLGLGQLAYRLQRYGARIEWVAVAGMIAFMLVQLGLVVGWAGAVTPLCVAFGFFGTAGILPYAALSQRFPRELAGRVNTAINLLVFLAAFAWQWAIGGIIDLWPAAGSGYEPAGYGVALGSILSLQAAALLCYLGGLARGLGPQDSG